MSYGGELLHTNHHGPNPNLLIQNALEAISHPKFVNEDFHRLSKAMLGHAPTQKDQASAANDIESSRAR